MSADFWAGYISGAAGILIGNPLDLIKVRLQAGAVEPKATASTTPTAPSNINRTYGSTDGTARSPSQVSSQSQVHSKTRVGTTYLRQFESSSALIRGATAPILGYGALNALLFVTYNRTTALLTPSSPETAIGSINGVGRATEPTLLTTWIAGAVGGLATWIVSTPTEVVKCRAQMQRGERSTSSESSSSSPLLATSSASSTTSKPPSSFSIARSILQTEGIQGFFVGGIVTALRDSIGYGFYFWSYELSTRMLREYMRGPSSEPGNARHSSSGEEAAKVLLCGGIAGVVTWASVYHLDVIKTRVQTQTIKRSPEGGGLLNSERVQARNASSHGDTSPRRAGALEMTRYIYRTEGLGAFWRGFTICSVRAFIVNAAQWAVYEWIMRELDPARREGALSKGREEEDVRL